MRTFNTYWRDDQLDAYDLHAASDYYAPTCKRCNFYRSCRFRCEGAVVFSNTIRCYANMAAEWVAQLLLLLEVKYGSHVNNSVKSAHQLHTSMSCKIGKKESQTGLHSPNDTASPSLSNFEQRYFKIIISYLFRTYSSGTHESKHNSVEFAIRFVNRIYYIHTWARSQVDCQTIPSHTGYL